eukprot:gene11204-biopygen1818
MLRSRWAGSWMALSGDISENPGGFRDKIVQKNCFNHTLHGQVCRRSPRKGLVRCVASLVRGLGKTTANADRTRAARWHPKKRTRTGRGRGPHVSGLWYLAHHTPHVMMQRECGHMTPSPSDCAPDIPTLPDKSPEPRAGNTGGVEHAPSAPNIEDRPALAMLIRRQDFGS